MSRAAAGATTRQAVLAPRRSTRERKPTTIQIDGHTVLRKNNYRVRGLEYVWGKENEDPNESTTSGDEEDPDYDPEKEAALRQKRSIASKRSSKRYKASPEEVARIKHNKQVEESAKITERFRFSFLAKNIDYLEPFCEPSDLEPYQDREFDDYQGISVTSQPAAIQTALRAHQMEGLEFMVNMHRQNLSMILGDEMGLVR